MATDYSITPLFSTLNSPPQTIWTPAKSQTSPLPWPTGALSTWPSFNSRFGSGRNPGVINGQSCCSPTLLRKRNCDSSSKAA